MANMNIKRQSDIIWVDSNSDIRYRTGLLQDHGYRVARFNETIDALNAPDKRHLEPNNVKYVITSMMKRGGRREKGFSQWTGNARSNENNLEKSQNQL